MCFMWIELEGTGPLDDESLNRAWQQNHHGGGYMFVVDSELIIRKGYVKLKEFLADYKADKALHGAATPFVGHFRYGTSGDRSIDNMHPHILNNGDVGLVHNGILNIAPAWSSGDTRSDTAYFCQTVLAHRSTEFLTSNECREWLEPIIGERNKFVIMDSQKRWQIVNCGSGITEGARWYSNSDHMPSLPTKQQASASCVTRGELFYDDRVEEIEWALANLEYEYELAIEAGNWDEGRRLLSLMDEKEKDLYILLG